MKTSLRKKSVLVLSSIALVAAVAIPTTANAATPSRFVTVSAEGTVKVTPDAVRLNATVSVISATNKAALAEVAKGAEALRASLKSSGIVAKDISSQNVSVYPEYNYTNDKGAVLVGYRGTQNFVVTIRNAANAGTVVDAAVAAGGDNLQINGVTPFVLDASKATEYARNVAVKNAKTKAASYAKLLGVKLGKVNSLVENGSPAISSPTYTLGAEAKADMAATVIDLGQQDVTVSITIQWSL